MGQCGDLQCLPEGKVSWAANHAGFLVSPAWFVRDSQPLGQKG